MSSWGQGSTRATKRARKQVLDRDNHRCQLRLDCCINHATQAHHINSIAAAGQPRAQATNIDDMIAVCEPCHSIVTETQRLAAVQLWRENRSTRRRAKPHPGAD